MVQVPASKSRLTPGDVFILDMGLTIYQWNGDGANPFEKNKVIRYDTIRYDTRCHFNVRSKADMSQLNLPHGNDN